MDAKQRICDVLVVESRRDYNTEKTCNVKRSSRYRPPYMEHHISEYSLRIVGGNASNDAKSGDWFSG